MQKVETNKGQAGQASGMASRAAVKTVQKVEMNRRRAVVEGVKLDAYGQEKFQKTLQELQEEREAVKDLLGA